MYNRQVLKNKLELYTSVQRTLPLFPVSFVGKLICKANKLSDELINQMNFYKVSELLQSR